METSSFLDIDENDRSCRKLFNAENIKFKKRPACYVIENKETNNLYVGSTKDISSRSNHHRQALKTGNHHNRNLQKEYNNCKNKENFIIEIAYYKDVEEARDREQLILDEGYKCSNLLNLSSNARIGGNQDRKKHAIAKMTETKNTQEYKNKVSKQSKKNWENIELRKQMIKSMGHNIIVNGTNYGSVREASREIGVSIKTIRDRLVDNTCDLSNIRKQKRSVICENKEFNSVTEAANHYKIKPNSMIARLKSSKDKWIEFKYKD